MATLNLNIDGRSVDCPDGKSILEAALAEGIYIPHLCYHPDLPPAKELTLAKAIFQGDTRIVGEKPDVMAGEEAHCNLCLVEVNGQAEPIKSCITAVREGMVIRTDTDEVVRNRKIALARILADHPHACLTCAQKEGCSLTSCSANVPVEERCCTLLGRCTLEKVSDYIGIPGDTPKYIPKHRSVIKDDPLFDRDFNLCIGCLRCARICRDVRGVDVLGAVWKEDRAWVGTIKSAGLKDADCRFCGACVEVCPTGALLDKEGVFSVRGKTSPPCVENCPAGIDIPRYLRLIALGRHDEALNVIRSSVPFARILGYVCFHPCEDVCRRGCIDQAVAICALKRFVADDVKNSFPIHRHADTGKKVAVIGSGPTGLSAAYYLRASGHQVDIFDQAPLPGGMLSNAIPDYRLPPEVFDSELKILEKAGVNFQMNRRLDSSFGFAELKASGFDAILIAIGTSVSKTLPVEGSDLDGIYPGLEFLRSAKLSKEPRLEGQVVVIGGGNVAIDAAMSAIRLGAKDVHLVCLESRDEMPAHEWEIAQALEEGVVFHPLWGPKRFKARDGRVAGVELVRCIRVFDEQGRFKPQYDENEIDYISADSVVITIGQDVGAEFFDLLEGLKKGPAGTLEVNENYATGVDGVFAAGDAVRGASSVVEAIAHGRQAAEAIDKYLGGSGLAEFSYDTAGLDNPRLDESSASIQRPRQNAEMADPAIQKVGFDLIEKTLTEQAARLEAERCLQCHLRQNITPEVLPPEPWLPLSREAVESVSEAEGVYQLLNAEKKVIRISGTPNLRQSLADCLEDIGEARYFMWEEDPLFTKRESELVQRYLQRYGRMPGAGDGDDLDDLF